MTRHSPDCVGCADPARLPALLESERALLDHDALRAREHRAVGEAARARALDYLIARDGRRYEQMQARMLYHLGAANAIASSVRMGREHLDRVEAAHRHLIPTSPAGGKRPC